jgi:branched-subunit amino acid transport protein
MSFLRTLVFQVVAVLWLPVLLGGIDGIWLSIVVAELLAAVVTTVFLICMRKKYSY